MASLRPPSPPLTAVPLNGTVYVKWDWKEETAPKLMVLLTNKNTTIFHSGGHAPPGTTGLGGKGLYDMQECEYSLEGCGPRTCHVPRLHPPRLWIQDAS